MSWEASTHALGLKLGNATRKLVLMGYANHAHADGTASFPSVKTVAKYAECSERSVQRHVAALVDLGYMREGDQQLVSHYAHGKRPIVYDLAMNEDTRAEWEVINAAGGNKLRGAAIAAGAKGAAAKAQVRTGDNLSPVGIASNGDAGTGDNLSPVGRGDTRDASGVTNEAFRGDTGVTQTTQETIPMNRPSSSSETADAVADAESEPVDEKNDRDDVARICEHLRQRIIQNGYKPVPSITKKWRDSARLMLDADGRTERQVHNMIDWCQNDDFWRPNIRSMPKLREHYDAMRERAMADARKRELEQATPKRGDIDWDAAAEQARQMGQALGFGSGGAAQ